MRKEQQRHGNEQNKPEQIERSRISLHVTLDQLTDPHNDALWFHGRMTEAPGDKRLYFPKEFDAYTHRLWTPAYRQHVHSYAVGVQEKLGRRPDVWMIIPTRREVGTSQTVAAILQDCSQDIVPGIIIFHNYTLPPLVETREDLTCCAQYPNVALIERHLQPSETMGDIRGFATDVAMTAASQWGMGDPILGSTDADITGFEDKGTITRALRRFRDRSVYPQVDIVSLWNHEDISLYLHNPTVFWERTITDAFERLAARYMRLPVNTEGRGTLIRAATLCAIGSYPSISKGEDVVIGRGVRQFRGKSTTNIRLNDVVLYDGREQTRIPYGESQYATWEDRTEEPKPIIPPSSRLDIDRLHLALGAAFIHRFFDAEAQEVFKDRKQACQRALSALVVRLYEEIHSSVFADTLDRASLQQRARQFTAFSEQGSDNLIAQAQKIVWEDIRPQR